ncbi:MAG: hypothetical protein IJI12_03380 [Atopobiaceae bacterium]|nr:hypothetical protein [Atopobiaceae bacterium]
MGSIIRGEQPRRAGRESRSTRQPWARNPCREGVDERALNDAMRVLVYDASDMRETGPRDAYARMSRVLNDRRFRRSLANARNNWLGANVDKVVAGILRHYG